MTLYPDEQEFTPFKPVKNDQSFVLLKQAIDHLNR